MWTLEKAEPTKSPDQSVYAAVSPTKNIKISTDSTRPDASSRMKELSYHYYIPIRFSSTLLGTSIVECTSLLFVLFFYLFSKISRVGAICRDTESDKSDKYNHINQ
jgi:hypothetical protein